MCALGSSCQRPVCFFAHHLHQLRGPLDGAAAGASGQLPAPAAAALQSPGTSQPLQLAQVGLAAWAPLPGSGASSPTSSSGGFEAQSPVGRPLVGGAFPHPGAGAAASSVGVAGPAGVSGRPLTYLQQFSSGPAPVLYQAGPQSGTPPAPRALHPAAAFSSTDPAGPTSMVMQLAALGSGGSGSGMGVPGVHLAGRYSLDSRAQSRPQQQRQLACSLVLGPDGTSRGGAGVGAGSSAGHLQQHQLLATCGGPSAGLPPMQHQPGRMGLATTQAMLLHPMARPLEPLNQPPQQQQAPCGILRASNGAPAPAVQMLHEPLLPPASAAAALGAGAGVQMLQEPMFASTSDALLMGMQPSMSMQAAMDVAAHCRQLQAMGYPPHLLLPILQLAQRDLQAAAEALHQQATSAELAMALRGMSG
jgi:hypothetical protein